MLIAQKKKVPTKIPYLFFFSVIYKSTKKEFNYQLILLLDTATIIMGPDAINNWWKGNRVSFNIYNSSEDFKQI